ncbi:hypothetical protein ACO1O0_009166 [Amphichorda felina]
MSRRREEAPDPNRGHPNGAAPTSALSMTSRATPSTWASRWKLPAWLDHFNSRDLKVFFRCWVAVWVAVLLIFIHPALTSLGLAAFFGALLLFIVPPTGILIVYLIAALTLLLGMCLAWAWGLLTMKAALAARPEAATQRKLLALKQAAVAAARQTGGDPAWEAQVLVHDGFMLDARVTAVFYAMGLVFVYVAARLRSGNPKLVPAQLFGTIVTDLFILFGPTLPSYQASLAEVLVKPGAVGVGLGFACCLLFFPQSTSYVVLDKMEKLIRMFDTSIDATKRRLAKQEVPLEELKALREKMLFLYKSMDPLMAFMPLDISRGRWNADDVEALHTLVRDSMVASISLLDLHISSAKLRKKEEHLEMHRAAAHDAANGENGEKSVHPVGQHQLLENADLMDALRDPEMGAMDARSFEALGNSTAETLQVCSTAVELASRCIRTVNSCRWTGKPSQETFDGLARELQDLLATLRTATDRCLVNTTEGVIETYASLFDEQGQLKDPNLLGPPSLRGIALAMIMEERILGAARKLEALLEHILRLMQTRTTHRIWPPSRLQYAKSWIFSSRSSMPTVSTATDDTGEDPDSTTDTASLEDQSREAYRRLRVSRGYETASSRRGPVSRAVAASYNWLFGTAGMFGLRMVVVTFATSIPAAIPHSAGFFYREKGIWGVITAQTCVVVYMADFTFSMISRFVGTIFGGVLGMVAWYMGSGNGPGNPYGMAASSGLMVAVMVWLRIFLPPAFVIATILSGVTFCLVVGFSYDQHHIRQYGLPGTGYVAFWKRLVTVLLGFVAAAVVQVLPSPPSATKHVSKTLANTVRTLSDHYALLLSHWGRSSDHSPLQAVAEDISVAVADRLVMLSVPIKLLHLEFTLSPFNQAVLRDMQEQCQHLNQALRRLLNLSTSLPVGLQDRLVQTAGLMDDAVIGDIMAVLGIVEQSLRTGSPLPERLPTPLVSRFYDSWHRRGRRGALSVALVRDEDYRRYCVAVSSYLRFLGTIDDMVLVLKRRLGECHVIHRWEDV